MTFQTVEQLQAQIASLTAENERLQALVKTAYADGFTDAWEDTWLNLTEERNWHWEHSDTRAALQPKEGEG